MMSTRGMRFALAAAMILASTPLLADDLSGSDKFLCTTGEATLCFAEGDCVAGPSWNWNIPQFIQVDLGKKMLSSTKASGRERTTEIKNMERADGMIFLQGVQRGRAFSLVITEDTGMLSAGVATDGVATAVFGACTPMQ